jgi:aminoglycoside phosphotransferase (APT) family kinase protein
VVRLVAAVLPGGRPAGVHRLKGGVVSSTHRIDVSTASGGWAAVVVRRFDRGRPWYADDLLRREWAVLERLRETPVPAPEPLLLDLAGEYLGSPTLVLSCLPGRPAIAHSEPRWCRRLAEGLALIHQQSPWGEPDPELVDWQGSAPGEVQRGDRRADRIFEALAPLRAQMVGEPKVFAHYDFHPGNTLWQQGRLTGVVDWLSAASGWAGADVAYGKLDLTLQLGPEAGDRFAAAYSAVVGRPLEHAAAWDATAALRALPSLAPWLEGYHDLGRRDLTVEEVGRRLDAFIAIALRPLS